MKTVAARLRDFATCEHREWKCLDCGCRVMLPEQTEDAVLRKLRLASRKLASKDNIESIKKLIDNSILILESDDN